MPNESLGTVVMSLQNKGGYVMRQSRLESLIDHLEEIYGIPNCDISIYREHEEIFRRSSGFTDLERKKRPTDQDLYWIYSASKVSLTVMILQLVEQGRLRLEDPVCRYIPEYGGLMVRNGDSLIPCSHQATIEDCLSMQGGLDYDIQRKDILDYMEVRPEASSGPVGEFGWDGYAGAFLLADVDNRISMFFAMSVGDMMPVKQIHHKIRDLMYEEMI